MNPWNDEDGQKAILKMGWPEWWVEGRKYHIGQAEWNGNPCFVIYDSKGWCQHDDFHGWSSTHLPLAVALALLRDHAREWLLERGIFLSPDWKDGKVGAWGIFNAHVFGWLSGDKWLPAQQHAEADHFPDYDTALIKAVLVAEQKKANRGESHA